MRRIEAFLKSHIPAVDAAVRNNLRFYLGMMAAMKLCKTPKPSAEKIAALDVTSVTDAVLEPCLVEVTALYQKLGGTDRVAKGTELVGQLRSETGQVGSLTHNQRNDPHVKKETSA